MAKQLPELSVLIPAYMEADNLRLLLPRLNKSLNQLDLEFEIIVIDTRESFDTTNLVCQEENVTYVNREEGDSYGDAIRSGIKHACGNKIVFMDGDGSHTPEFISKLIKHADENDVVIASRYIKGGATDNKLSLILLSKIVNILYSIVLNLKCKDVSNSFKLYHKDQLKKLQLSSRNFDIVEEILYKLKKNNKNLKIKEIPYTFKQRMFGHTKRNLLTFVFSFAFTLIKLRFSK